MNAPFLPGDMLPPISLPGPDGTPFDLAQQTIAAQPRILLLGGATVPKATKDAAARGAALFTVRAAAPDPKAPPGTLFDPEGRLFAALGLPEGGVAVISPRGRLAFARAGDTLSEALATLPDPEPAVARRSGAPVLLIPGILEADFIAALLAHWAAGEKQADRVASRAGGAATGPIANIKRRADVFLDDRALYAGFQARIERRVLPEMWRAFRFRAASFEAPRIGCYDAKEAGGFGAHRDNRTPFTAHRRFAMSLNLNTGAYEGGRVVFPEFGADEYEPEAGGAVIFCCDLLHEARPVTRGQRFAIFTFFTDAEGAAQERKLKEQAMAQGQRGVTMR